MIRTILQLQFDTTNFWTINWYYIVALTTSIIGVTIAYKNYNKKPQDKKDGNNLSNNNFNNSSNLTNNTHVPVSIVNNITSMENKQKNVTNSNSNDENVKATTKILFIDDNHTEYKIVSILKKAGWTKTKSVKDVTDLDCIAVTESDIIFVDINGVGIELFEDQGLGLAAALKKKYPHKKIVIYSSENTGDRFHEALRIVDHSLPKNADAYQFINLIENLLKS
jgi:hypothetical protein